MRKGTSGRKCNTVCAINAASRAAKPQIGGVADGRVYVHLRKSASDFLDVAKKHQVLEQGTNMASIEAMVVSVLYKARSTRLKAALAVLECAREEMACA